MSRRDARAAPTFHSLKARNGGGVHRHTRKRRRVTAGSRPHPPTILRNASDNMSANVTDTSGARAGGGADVQSEKPETHLP